MTASNQSHQSKLEQARQLLSPYLDGEVTAEERALVEEAAASSAELRRELETLRQTISLVRSLPPRPAPRPFTLSEADVQPAKPAPGRGFIFPGWLRNLAIVAATLLCVLALGGVFFSQQFLGGMSSLGPDEIARLEEQTAEESAPAPEMAMEAEPAEETAADQERVEVTEAPAPVAVEKETVPVEIEEAQEAPAEEAAEEEAMIAGEAADESEEAAAGEVAESAAPEEDELDRGGEPATPTPASTLQAFGVPSPTTGPSAEKVAPPQPSLAEGGPDAAEEEAPAEQNLAQSETSEPFTPTLTPPPTPTVAPPSPEPTVTPQPTAMPQPEVSQPVRTWPITWLIGMGLIVMGGLIVIGFITWVLVRKR